MRIMWLARNIGRVVATHKCRSLEGSRLVILRRLTHTGIPYPEEMTEVAVDAVGSAVGTTVIVITRSSVQLVNAYADVPIDAVIVGIVDCITTAVDTRGCLCSSQIDN